MIIDKVIVSLQELDTMEEINKITGLNVFDTDNWCDLSQFEQYPKLRKYITKEELKALKDKKADYIAFRLDY